jgi:hypothetical protein
MFHKQRNEKNDATAGARALGWGSIGIGLMELLAPDRVQSMLGIEDRASHRGILRALGVRELMHGIGILTEDRPTPQLTSGVWARVAGDVLDSALLGVAATKTKRPSSFAAMAAMVTGIGIADVVYAVKVKRHEDWYGSYFNGRRR